MNSPPQTNWRQEIDFIVSNLSQVRFVTWDTKNILKNLVYPTLWHRKFQEHSKESNQNQRSWYSYYRPRREPVYQLRKFTDLQNNRGPKEEDHRRVKLAPMIFQVRIFSLKVKGKHII